MTNNIIYMISITFGVLVFCSMLVRIGDFENQKGHVKSRIDKIQATCKKGVLPDDDELSKPLTERFLKPLFNGFIKSMQKYLPEEKIGEVSSQSTHFNKHRLMLRQAGMKIGVNQYIQLRLIVMAATGILSGIIGMLMRLELIYIIFLIVLGFYAAYVAFRFHLMRRISIRRESMQRQLPEVLDMLSVSVEAGLGLEQAMIQVVDHFNGPLLDEIAVTNREMAMGRSRREALLLLGDRCEIHEMKSFVRAVVQASQLGISIKNVLRSQAALMRQGRKNKIEEKAMKVSVKILLPMAFFIFPVLFIVLLGPAVASIVENLM